ncbi:fructosamine kinase family protein [[Mycobacterium] wendilense]|uniref:Fructosamine kinase family protein n=1 Tax=[Mycobacterium] wendilense TaxID=3064284 RepID=A0ABN9P7Y7_9MYCO|nr:fructosamine kinase family protein [Mycolicibacterium sp. MU0050]CAJ1586489.1 fructosamine kinase family protein [Mycolicibacterium sp. MU0050]
MQTFTKRNLAAPPGFFACEAAGLQWLSEAHGARCAEVVAYDDTSLTLVRLDSVAPHQDVARAFGQALATTHDAGARGWGAPPECWDGPGFFGPLQHPLPISFGLYDSWGRFYADARLEPLLRLVASALGSAAVADVEEVVRRCRAGDYDDDDTPARLHGDLWQGNIIWTENAAVLIDPAGHGGHRETDLAMLHLFGCPLLDAIIDGYQRGHPLLPGWRDRLGLHQLFPLLAHVALFGAGFAHQTHEAARKALALN